MTSSNAEPWIIEVAANKRWWRPARPPLRTISQQLVDRMAEVHRENTSLKAENERLRHIIDNVRAAVEAAR